MKVLVTGGAGFIGSHLVDKLIRLKHRVAVVDNLSTGKKEFVNPRAKFYKTDIVGSSLKSVFAKEKPEFVFHLAAQKSVPFSLKYPLVDARTNILGSLNVIENSLAVKVKKFIFISTGGAIYGETKMIPSPEETPARPNSPYGLSKLTVENFLINYYHAVKQLDYVCLRLSNVYGPRQDPLGEAGVIAIFINNLLKNKNCHINGQGKQTRDFVYVADVVEAGIKAIKSGHGLFNIGTAKETSINKIYQLIATALHSAKKVEYWSGIPGEVNRSVLKISKAKRGLGWSPQVDLEQGIDKTIDYFLSLI